LGDGTYTGLNLVNPTRTELGYVSGDRFIDTSSRIDITDWFIQFNSDLTSTVDVKLATYNTLHDHATPYYMHATPSMVSDWAFRDNILPGDPILFINAERYAFFELTLASDQSISDVELELFIFIDISSPVINGYFPATKKIQDKFPEWMALREYNPLDPENATPATPNTVGGQLINALAGEWVTDLRSRIQFQQFQFYIDSAELSQKDWVYTAKITSPVPAAFRSFIYSVVGDGEELTRVSGIGEFQDTLITDDAYFFNPITNDVFTNKSYATLTINGEVVTQQPYQVWNTFDDIGVSVDLFRLYLEDNDSFKKRILDVYKNKPGVTLEAFKLALRRELNLWTYWGSTPNSDYLGATPNVIEIEDIENDPVYFGYDGIPTKNFYLLVDELAKKHPMTWGNFRYGTAFWDPDGLEHKGFGVIPRQFDATPMSESYMESGVGDVNDLYVFKPGINTSAEVTDITLVARGKNITSTRSEYLPLKFGVMVWGKATQDVWTSSEITANFTIEVTVIDNTASPASPNQDVYYCNITLSSTSDVDYDVATPTDHSISLCEWYTPDGYTDKSYRFISKYTGEEPTDGHIDLANATKIEIIKGHYEGDIATPTYSNLPTDSEYRLWLTDDPSTYLGSGGTTFLSINSFDYLVDTPELNFQSRSWVHTGLVADYWTSEAYTYAITLNGVIPDMTADTFMLRMPEIQWPASTSNRTYEVQILTNSGGVYGTYAADTSATPIFLSDSYIMVDGNNTWTNGLKSFSSATTTITFSSGTGLDYPATVPVWEQFEYTLPAISATVDRNGPWRYGEPLGPENSSFMLDNLYLTRDDFGIPNTTDYIVTWIGIKTVSNPEVACWTESSIVSPAVFDYSGDLFVGATYNDLAIVESLNESDVYEYTPIKIYAKLKPSSNAKWYPKVHSGWFHDDVEEYYLYAEPVTETATANSKVLSGLNRQGAPIIVKAIQGSTPAFELRQVALWEDDSTPTLGSYNVETVSGTGINRLYSAYSNIRDITVTNITTAAPVTLSSTSSSSNVITTSTSTNVDHTYQLRYAVAKAFYVENDHATSTLTRLFFDATPEFYNANYYQVTYESSIYDPATPVDVPLNPLYTSIDQGFVYIDHDVHDVAFVEMRITPSKILADANDYGLITLRAYDVNGNPKPNQTFVMFTNFGTLDHATISTDRDGYAYNYIQSELWDGVISPSPSTPSLPEPILGSSTQGFIVARGTREVMVGFDIQVKKASQVSIMANSIAETMNSEDEMNYIVGRVEDANHDAVPYAAVKWRKARTLFEVFNSVSYSTSLATPGSDGINGMVIADSDGRFTIGPFSSNGEHGYWVTSVETNSTSPNVNTQAFSIVGDTVQWYEHPEITSIVDEFTFAPIATVQSATPDWLLPRMTSGPAFPVTFDEDDTEAGYVSGVVNWTPPSWYPLDQYEQYQMGLYGSTYEVAGATPSYPDYKEI
jgi:hypothetical protein